MTIIKVKTYEETIQMKCEIGLVLEILQGLLLVDCGITVQKHGKFILTQLEDLKKRLDTNEKEKIDYYDVCENGTFGFQDIIARLLELLRPYRIVRDESVANLGHTFQRELNFKPSEFSSRH